MYTMRSAFLVLVATNISPPGVPGEVIHRRTEQTLCAVELNHGDTLEFMLRNGQTRTLFVESTEARVLLTNVPQPKKGFHGGATLYEMACRVRIDGHPMTMRRYVPVQQSFYEPCVVNGMRIWFDAVRGVERFLNDNHGGGLPRKDARFAVQDATEPICPQPLRPWYPSEENCIDVARCYNADDVWMGPYFGTDLHGGLDVNMPIGTPLWAPIDFDTQYYFNSLQRGDNNNRWRAVRTWENGQRWVLQAHHMVRLLVPENTPLRQNVHYAEAAGVLTGTHAHSHFVFKVGPEEDEILLDPWIIFWQIFENNKRRAGEIRAAIEPVGPAKTGQAIKFDGSGSSPGVTGNTLRYRWTFGDGGTAIAAAPTYVFTRPGIYPVTLTVCDGVRRARTTQHITIDGEAVDDRPALVLQAPEAVTFQPWRCGATDVYGRQPALEPCTLRFTARPGSSPRPAAQNVLCRNGGGGRLADPAIHVQYLAGRNWLAVSADGHRLSVAVDASQMPNRHGEYRADVTVDCLGALNSPQVFSVHLTVPPPQNGPRSSVTVDNNDDECFAAPWAWVSPQFHQHFPDRWKPGYRGDYLVHTGAGGCGELVRFTPDLRAGKYDISLPDETPFRPSPLAPEEVRFAVRVRHKHGLETVWIQPLESRRIGSFEFAEGTEGYVEILAEGASGLVVADAVRFERQED